MEYMELHFQPDSDPSDGLNIWGAEGWRVVAHYKGHRKVDNRYQAMEIYLMEHPPE